MDYALDRERRAVTRGASTVKGTSPLNQSESRARARAAPFRQTAAIANAVADALRRRRRGERDAEKRERLWRRVRAAARDEGSSFGSGYSRAVIEHRTPSRIVRTRRHSMERESTRTRRHEPDVRRVKLKDGGFFLGVRGRCQSRLAPRISWGATRHDGLLRRAHHHPPPRDSARTRPPNV